MFTDSTDVNFLLFRLNVKPVEHFLKYMITVKKIMHF